MIHQDYSGLAQKYSPVDLLLSFSNHSEMVGGGFNLFIQHTSVDHMEIAIGAKETQPPPWMVFNGLYVKDILAVNQSTIRMPYQS